MEKLPCSTVIICFQVKSWRRWFVKCSSCYCLCDEATDSERHFSLHEVVSDIEQNKYVDANILIAKNIQHNRGNFL